MKKTWLSLLPSLLLACGMLAATTVSVHASESRWQVLAGPLVMAGAIVAGGLLGYGLQVTSKATAWAALLYGGAVLLAGAIVASRDPGLVPSLLPMLGAVAAAMMIPSARRSGRYCSGRAV